MAVLGRFILMHLVAAFLFAAAIYPAHAESLVNFGGGNQLRTEDLLSQGKALIYIEKDCFVCKRYVLGLKACSESVKNAIALVSVSTAAQTKEMARSLPREFPLYIVKRQEANSVLATPTTKYLREQKVGILKCEDLDRLLASNPTKN